MIDTSVVVKWAVEEAQSDAARALIGDDFIAPDLMQAELAHVLSRRCRAGEFSELQALAGQALIESAVTFIPTGQFSRRALELSLELGHPAGDCFFLSLSEVSGATFLTADVKLAGKCRGGAYEKLVQLL